MYVQRNALGFWGELLTAATQVGTAVYKTKTDKKIATEQLKAQVEQQRRQLENDRRVAELQAQAAAAALIPAPSGATLPPGAQIVPTPAGGYTVVLDPAGSARAWPVWALPAAIVGGGLVLSLLLRRAGRG
jgi:hypothetical protein